MSLARAIESGDLAALPSRRDEDWRWSDLRGLIRIVPPASPPWDGALVPGPFAGVDAQEVLIVNGRGPQRVSVMAGEVRTLALRLVAAANSGAHVTRLIIEVGEGASLTLLESHEGHGQAYLVESELTFSLAKGARVERIVATSDSELGVNVCVARVELAAETSFAQTLLTTGARRQRLETKVSHPGAGARVRLDGLYQITGRRHGDLTTSVVHDGVDGVTDQLTKGVVSGQGRGVFQGLILVRPGADRTDARLGHHALILSDTAEIDAKPELEIYADDVACAHGNTVGALDEDALFYARQRGLTEGEAKALLTAAFLAQVVERIEHEGARELARAWVAAGPEGAS